jgi:hypothetical protein
VDAAIDATEKIAEHDRKEAAKKTPAANDAPEEMEPIANFRTANPAIDPSSPDYNEEFNAEVELSFNTLVRRAHDQKRTVTDAMINRWLKKSMKDATDLFGDDAPAAPAAPPPSESPRNQRPGQGAGKRRQAGKPAEAKAENYQIENPRNPRQKNAASEIRDLIKDKYGDDDAKSFERSLSR